MVRELGKVRVEIARIAMLQCLARFPMQPHSAGD
jgi:hypothetical protein